MINIKDLRAGNHIRINFNDLSFDTEIVALSEGACFVKEGAFTIGYSYQNCVPIPITVETILQYGFVDKHEGKVNYLRCYTNKDLEFLPPQEAMRKLSFGITLTCHDSYFNTHLPHIEYMHQLQNLYYSLYNIELTKTIAP